MARLKEQEGNNAAWANQRRSYSKDTLVVGNSHCQKCNKSEKEQNE